MPTLAQLEDWVRVKKAKYGPGAHCNQPICSEEARKEAIENKPDAKGRQRTRIALETYSPRAYQDWNAMLEMLMERCGCNPILVVDLLQLLVREAGRERDIEHDLSATHTDGIAIALHELYRVCDFEQELREAKELRRKRRMKEGK